MHVVLVERGFTNDAGELNIRNRYMRDLEAGNLNQHHENM